MTEQEMMEQGPCPHADSGRPLPIEVIAEAIEKADPGGVKAHELVIKYQNSEFECQVCGEKIEKIGCQTHEEAYEIGHKDDCPYNQIIKEGCVID